ncbi:MAG: redoxin domain-containing protein [Lewinellaceae bacterium]|nr:redoxin domain-containing protein [Lewinellaceae bacterium]
MRKITFLLAFFACCSLSAQDIPFIKSEQINYWKNADNDTLYVLNFWATWCAPCVEELPSFEKLNRAYADRKVKVVLISTDFKRNVETRVKPFVKERGLQSEVVFMNESNPNNYINLVDTSWTGAIPATLIYSKRKGVSLFFEKKLDYESLETAVKTALETGN